MLSIFWYKSFSERKTWLPEAGKSIQRECNATCMAMSTAAVTPFCAQAGHTALSLHTHKCCVIGRFVLIFQVYLRRSTGRAMHCSIGCGSAYFSVLLGKRPASRKFSQPRLRTLTCQLSLFITFVCVARRRLLFNSRHKRYRHYLQEHQKRF
jgi:hypothetical protein